ncbi:MAG: glycosyltransferase, partial [Clostridium sporogenes]|nr:glycosyltransferase [Clostridium sporogenes]
MISLCLIVKNEEETLLKCLDSAKNIAQEIIIIDTGST